MMRVDASCSFGEAVWVDPTRIYRGKVVDVAQGNLADLNERMECVRIWVAKRWDVLAASAVVISAASISGIVLFSFSPLVNGILAVSAAVSALFGVSVLVLHNLAPLVTVLNSARTIESYKAALKKREFNAEINADAITVMRSRKEAMDQIALDTPRQLQIFINGRRQGKGKDGAKKMSASLGRLLKDRNCERRVLSALHQGIAAPTTLFSWETFHNAILNCHAFEDRRIQPFRIDVEIKTKDDWRIKVATGWRIAQIVDGNQENLARYKSVHMIDGPTGRGRINFQKVI